SLSAALAAPAAAVKAELIGTTARAAARCPLAPAGGVLRSKAALALLTLGLLAAGAGGALQRDEGAEPTAPPAPAREPAAPPQPAAPVVEKGETVTVSGRALGPDGKPFAGARVYLVYHTVRQVRHQARATSGADGRFRFTYSKAEDTG